MEDHHLTPEELRRLLDRDRGEEETRLLLHTLAVCPACRAVGGSILDLYREGAIGLTFCMVDIELARSRASAPALFEELSQLSFEEQLERIEEDDRFQTIGLSELLCLQSERVAASDALRATDLAELAVFVASRLSPGPIERSWLDQVLAHAFAHLGNARRVLGELRSAKDAFRDAQEFWEAGTAEAGDSFGYEARYLALKASLRREERHFEQALDLLKQALAAEGGPALRDAILVAKAKTLEEMGEPEQAIACLREVAAGIDPHAAPRLLLCIKHNLLLLLTAEGRHSEAEELLPAVRNLAETLGNRLDLLRLRWAEARIAKGREDLSIAAFIFEEVRVAFLAQEIGFDAALVSLELAVLRLEAGEVGEVKRIAREILPIFQSRDVHREALAALAVFRHAAETETVTVAFAKRLAEYLQKSRHNPHLQFAG
jgi:tetratricopeptide (TPR) repeat protein